MLKLLGVFEVKVANLWPPQLCEDFSRLTLALIGVN